MFPMHECKYVRMYVWVHDCLYVTHACMYACIYVVVCLDGGIYACMHVCEFGSMYSNVTSACVHPCRCESMSEMDLLDACMQVCSVMRCSSCSVM